MHSSSTQDRQGNWAQDACACARGSHSGGSSKQLMGDTWIEASRAQCQDRSSIKLRTQSARPHDRSRALPTPVLWRSAFTESAGLRTMTPRGRRACGWRPRAGGREAIGLGRFQIVAGADVLRALPKPSWDRRWELCLVSSTSFGPLGGPRSLLRGIACNALHLRT